MKEKHKAILKIIFITMIPVILNYLAKSDNCLDYLQVSGVIGDNVKLIVWKDIFLLAASIFTTVFISMKLVYLEINQKTIAKQRESLIKYNKNIFLSALASKLQTSNIDINIRIFVPKKGILLPVKGLIQKITGGCIKYERKFAIRNIEGLADTGITNNLVFEVYPNPQGLVGNCYKLRTIVYEENLKTTSVDYNLSEYQRIKTRDSGFCLCAPIFNEKGDIISIISFDSVQKINIPKNSKSIWIDMITNYCQFLNDYLPDLFK